MKLTSKDVRYLRAHAHKLKPVVIVGNAGVSEQVLREIDGALAHHELIKVRLNAADRDERQQMIDLICTQTGCAFIQGIGHIGIFYRQAEKPVLTMSSAATPARKPPAPAPSGSPANKGRKKPRARS